MRKCTWSAYINAWHATDHKPQSCPQSNILFYLCSCLQKEDRSLVANKLLLNSTFPGASVHLGTHCLPTVICKEFCKRSSPLGWHHIIEELLPNLTKPVWMASKRTNSELNDDPEAKHCFAECLFAGLSAGQFVCTEWSQCTVVLISAAALLQWCGFEWNCFR